MDTLKISLFAIIAFVMLFFCAYLSSPIIDIDFGSQVINLLVKMYTPIMWPLGMLLGAIFCLIGSIVRISNVTLGEAILRFGIWILIAIGTLLVCAAIILLRNEKLTHTQYEFGSGNAGVLVISIIAFFVIFLWGRAILKMFKKPIK